jgi:hypothetical protein
MDGTSRWRENWRVAAPPGATRVDVPWSRQARADAAAMLRRLPEGTPVVLAARAPFGIRRSRNLADRAGVCVDAEYLALPTVETPAFLVEDHPASISYFLQALLTAPPAGRLTSVLTPAVRVARAVSPWRVVRLLSPGRVLVGRRA